MGVLDSLFGSDSATDDTPYAILVNADPDNPGPALNGMEYALDLDDGGHDVEVYLDGGATKWPGHLAENPDHPLGDTFDEVAERGLLKGACGACAAAFDAEEGCRNAGIDIDAGEGHSPELSDLADDGYELMVVG